MFPIDTPCGEIRATETLFMQSQRAWSVEATSLEECMRRGDCFFSFFIVWLFAALALPSNSSPLVMFANGDEAGRSQARFGGTAEDVENSALRSESAFLARPTT